MGDKMILAKKPTVFISSTCYDLPQMRESISKFIYEKLSLDVLRSEIENFPLDPSIGNVNNCLRVIKERADILVLIIGDRYGSVLENGKSVTHMEYITAKHKGIPIYVFIKRETITLHKVWKNNSLTFFPEIDNTALFDFVEELFVTGDTWVHHFDTVNDIESVLKEQIPYLFNDCLHLKRQLQSTRMPKRILELGNNILNLILEKDVLWEYRLFGQVIKQGLSELENIKRDLKYGFTFDKRLELENPDSIFDWMSEKNIEILAYIEMVDILINKTLEEALGAPGIPGDFVYIVYVADKFVEIYKNIILWGIKFKSIVVNEDWVNLIRHLSKICDSAMADLDDFVNDCISKIEECYLLINSGSDSNTITISLNMRNPITEEFYNELENIRLKFILK